MRILIVSDAWMPQVSGVVRTHQNLVRELTDMGHQLAVIGPEQFRTVPLPTYREIRLALFPYRRLARLIEDFAPDAIHIPVEGPLGWAARRYCLKNRKSYTTSYHTHFPDYFAKRVAVFGRRAQDAVRTVTIAAIRRFHSGAKATFVATGTLEDILRGWGFAGRMVRLSRGADLNQFYPGVKKRFQNLPRPVLLYVGRISVEKNIEAFLDLDMPGSKVLIGHGPAQNVLERKYPDAVFLGNRTGEELGACFRSADVFVFPSKTDTFGIVMIEAMASGLPIAAYPATGPVDIVTTPILGALSADLGLAVKQALAGPGTPEMRFAYAKTHYSWRAVAETFLETQKTQAK